MTVALFLFFLVLLVAVLYGQSDKTCSVPGWFGPGCVFKCHCQNDTHENTWCHQTTGECAADSRCADGYTGTACQYSDLAFGRTTSFQSGCQGNQDSLLAVDRKDDTCFTARATGAEECSWSVNLFKASFVTQINLRVPPGNLDTSTWSVRCHNDMTKATTEARRRVSSDRSASATYFPPENFLMSRVEIVVPSKKELKLCEVNVIGGRNVALKKTASQGEITLNDTCGPEKAVDDEGKRFYHGQCAAATGRGDSGQALTSWWSVALGPNVLAWQAEIHTTPDQRSSITVNMNLSNGSLAEVTSKNEPRAGMVMMATDWPLQATQLIIKQRQKGNQLTLCEVRVLGDCLDGYFGWSCADRCNCSWDEVCDKVFGTCVRSRCQGHFRGPRCREACPPGFYGSGCLDECSAHCVDRDCLSTNGTCSKGCFPGWEGHRCLQTCASGFYGNSCDHKCSATCLGGLCDPVSGSCVNGCVVGFEGSCSENVTEVATEDIQGSEGLPVVLIAGVIIVLLAATGSLTAVVLRRRANRRRMLEMGSHSEEGIDANTALSGGEQEDLTPSSRSHVVATQMPSSRALARQSGSGQRTRTARVQPLPSLNQEERFATAAVGTTGRESGWERGGPVEIQRTSLVSLSSSDVSDTDLSSATSHGCSSEVDGDNFRSNVVAAADFPGKVARWLTDPELFRQERSALPEGKKILSKTALLPQNILKNRYRDIYLYDHSRVILDTLPGDPFSDFYNACYIDGYTREKEYIAAQGPLEKTVDDFLRMVWDVHCPCIVMLTNTVEMGRVKCHQYWPAEGDSFSTGSITVALLRTTILADFCIRDLILERRGKARTVRMLQYTAWPPNAPPSSTWSLLDFRSKVCQAAGPEGPSIVHCSAGIGRTGTFLAVDILLTRAEREKVVDVFTCVWNLRQQRAGMVQTLTQYMFIYEAVAAALVTSVPVAVKDFDALRWFRKEDKQRLIEKEYRSLKMFVSLPGNTGSTSDKDVRDRGRSELSRGAHRVSVFAVDKDFSSVFVNAVFLPSYRHERAFIQTHSPQDGGVVHFLSIVCQHHVSKIICLDTSDENGASGAIYWPDKGKSVTFEPYRVELLSARKEQGITTRVLRIHLPQLFDSVNEDGYIIQAPTGHDVTQYSCVTWPSSLLTPSWTSCDLKTLTEVGQPIGQGPVLVHCKDGHTRSGFFCVLSVILERMRTNGEVAISYVTGHMSVPRGRMIVAQEQLECLLHIVKSEVDDKKGETSAKSMCL